MPRAEQLPGFLSLALRQGDTFSTTIDFNIAVTGISWEAAIRSTVTGETVDTMTVTVTNASTGVLVLSLTDEETEALPVGVWGWTLVGTISGTKRTYFSGFLEVTG
jgi:hypothetical protein